MQVPLQVPVPMAEEMPGEPRTLRLQHGNRIEALCVLGGHVRADVFG